MRNNILIIFKYFISWENKINTFGTRRRQLLAYSRLAYRDHHGRQDEFSFPSSPLSSRLLSLPPYSISFYLSFDPLFFFPFWRDLSFSFFLRLHMHPHTFSHAKYTLRLLVVAPSLRPLPYLFPCPPHPVSVSGSNSGVSINLAITPRWISENGHVRHGENGTRLRLYRCIRSRCARVYVRG